MHSIRKMRPVATDGVAWSLSLSVCLCMCVGRVHEPWQITAESIKMLFGWVTRMGRKNHVLTSTKGRGSCESLLCCTLQKVTNGITVPLLLWIAMLPTGWCHFTTFLPHENLTSPFDAAFINILWSLVIIIIIIVPHVWYRNFVGNTTSVFSSVWTCWLLSAKPCRQ